jgi:hypothetical protein
MTGPPPVMGKIKPNGSATRGSAGTSASAVPKHKAATVSGASSRRMSSNNLLRAVAVHNASRVQSRDDAEVSPDAETRASRGDSERSSGRRSSERAQPLLRA